MKVFEIIEDSVIYKGVIVSKDGITFAKYKNIVLVKLNEIERNENERIEIIKPNLISRLVRW